MKHAVIFDMDGVLADTEPVYFRSNQALFRQLGFSVSPDDYAQFVGLDAELMWSRLKERQNLPHRVPDLVRLEKEGMLAGLQESGLQPTPGLHDLLTRIQSRAVRAAIASSSSHDVFRVVLSKLDLLNNFPVLVSGEDVASGKPAPEIILRAAHLLDCPPENCLVIEDSTNGVLAARAESRARDERKPGFFKQRVRFSSSCGSAGTNPIS